MIKQILSKSFSRNILGNFNRSMATADGSSTTKRNVSAGKKDFVHLIATWPKVKQDILKFAKKYDTQGTATNHYAKALDYNCLGDAHVFGLTTVNTFKQLADNPSDRDIELAFNLAWCVEMFIGAYNLIDDIGDQGKTRRGKQTWHTLEEVGLRATNDATLIISGIYRLLYKYFHDKDYYTRLVAIMHEAEHTTAYGMCLEYTMANRNILQFTQADLTAIEKSKVCFFYSSVASAMCMAGLKDPEVYRTVLDLTLKVGTLYQVQNDFQDLYGDPKVTGKVGTDIQENKCTWFSLAANQMGNARHREVLKRCYGSYDPEMVTEVKKVYNELGLFEAIMNHENALYRSILDQARDMGRLESIFIELLAKFDETRVKQYNNDAPQNGKFTK